MKKFYLIAWLVFLGLSNNAKGQTTFTYTNGLSFGTDIYGNTWNIWSANGSNVWDWQANYVGGYLHYSFKVLDYSGFYCSGSCRYHNIWNINPTLGFQYSNVVAHDVGVFPENTQDNHIYLVDIQWNATGYVSSVFDSTAGSQYSTNTYTHPVNYNTYDSWTWGYSIWTNGTDYVDENDTTHASQWTATIYQDGPTGTTGGGGDIRTDVLPILQYGANASQIIISNVIPNNSSFPNPKELWNGSTNQTIPVTKICADGSNATHIKFVNNTGVNSNNIRFWISSDPNGSNIDLHGYFTNYNVVADTITAEYLHPKYLQSSYMPFRSDSIHIVDTLNPSPIIFAIPIHIYRAPLVMVHGLWGDQGAFASMENALDVGGYYPNILTFKVDYYFSNSYSFAYNAGVVPNNINTLLSICRNNNFSAGKVDYIGHSMGGILGREYIQSPNYKFDIHKLITVNTPHSGTQAANCLKNPNFSTVSNIMWLYGNDDSNGAVDDLETNSVAMFDLYANGLSSHYLNVASHSICTNQPLYLSTLAWVSLLLNQEALAAGYASVNNFISGLYQGELNDLVVPLSSQQGGLTSNETTLINNQAHLGSCNNSAVQTEVENLINADPNSSSFNHSGFQPTPFPLTSIYRLSEPDTIASPQQMGFGNVTINSPTTNSSFIPGQQITIDVISNGTIDHLTVIEGNSSLGTTFTDTAVANATFSYIIPQNAIGRILISAVGSDSSGIIDFDTVSVIINITATLDSIHFYPEEIDVPVNGNMVVNLTGFFSDGGARDLSLVSGVQYQVADTNIATYVPNNLIHGVQVDTTNLLVSYQGVSAEIPIVVFPEDTSIVIDTSVVTNITLPSLHDNSFLNQLQVFPNPNNGEFVIQLATKEKELIQIEVYNQFGQKVFSQKEIAASKNFSKKIILNETSSGIYYIRVITSTNYFNSKIVLTR